MNIIHQLLFWLRYRKIAFSVILPTWNRAYLIGGAIDSLCAQTFQRVELIIVDDGSEDNTEEFIRTRYARELKAEKFRYLRVPHGGASHARNVGLKYARNSYIAYLDSDNAMVPHFLETFAKRIAITGAHCLYAKFRNREGGGIIGRKFSRPQLEKGNYIDIGVFVHHKSLVDEHGGFDEKLRRLVDWDVILRYTSNHLPEFIDEVLLEYNDSPRKDRISVSEDHDVAYNYITAKYKK